MEALVSILGLLCVLVAFAAGFFCCFVQPIWGIVDVAVSPRLSGGAKATIIVLTLILLGPVMTFFYALFGGGSPAFRKATIVSSLLLAFSAAGLLGLAALAPPRNGVSVDGGATAAAADVSGPAAD